MLTYHKKAKLALEAMEEIFGLYSRNHEGLALSSRKFKEIMEFWKEKTHKPFDKEEYYRKTEALIKHLRRKPSVTEG